MILNTKIKESILKTNDLEFYVLNSGDISLIKNKNTKINLFRASTLDGMVSNLFLKLFIGNEIKFTRLLGVNSNSSFTILNSQVIYTGTFENVNYKVYLTLVDNKWFYDVELNSTSKDIYAEVYYGQDVNLNDIEANELYTCQYIDHKVFKNDNGYVLSSKQNQGRSIALQIGSLTKNDSFSTDGNQFFGIDYRFTNIPKAMIDETLANVNYQYEFAYLALKSEKVKLEKTVKIVFYGILFETQETPSEILFMNDINEAFSNIKKFDEIGKNKKELKINLNDIFTSKEFTQEELNKFYPNKTLEEIIDNKLVAFVGDNKSHIVLQEKEHLVERSHATIITNNSFDYIKDDVLATTVHMNGVFTSHIVVGNTNFNKLSTHVKNYLNVQKLSGERLLVMIDGKYRLLGLPASFEMGINYAKWAYKIKDDVLEISVAASYNNPQILLEVKSLNNIKYNMILLENIQMGPSEFQNEINMDIIDNVITYKPIQNDMVFNNYPNLRYEVKYLSNIYKIVNDEVFYVDNKTENLSVITVVFENVTGFKKVVKGSVNGYVKFTEELDIQQIKNDYFQNYKENLNNFDLKLDGNRIVEKINNIFYWFSHNALIHYASPHGLEQNGGAAFGTRDVLQGPVEYFSMLGKYDYVRNIILEVYSTQHLQTGDWPQWFMFDNYFRIQAHESHGDIIVWPLRTIAKYIISTNDYSILEEKVPYMDLEKNNKTIETYTIMEHIEKEIERIKLNAVSGTNLTSYGGGDWDDTLQPCNKDLTLKMVSGWTILLEIEALENFALAINSYDTTKAKEALELSNLMKYDYEKYILRDNTPAGFVYFNNGNVTPMLHPEDKNTGLKYRLLPLTRGIISEFYSKEVANNNFKIIDENLKCPDGVRLMDKAVKYNGGKKTFFQRAETASNFGREIGLQYVHAHIRYIEALAKFGKAEDILYAITAIVPINIEETVKNALTRQNNMYFSSSDGCFNDRYDAVDNFNKLKTGEVKVKGGWRLYSSGPGIYLNQVVSNVLGIKKFEKNLVIDPVLPKEFNNLVFKYKFNNKNITIKYLISGLNNGVSKIDLNGEVVNNNRINNKYRQGGIIIDNNLLNDNNELVVYL